ncbi:MAG: hypothetical protein PHV68_04800 [Candidatus Gastranaerophilales bacterium]|nr:hypothetical protein [Candidatus Gastranaerophilales bacterium]
MKIKFLLLTIYLILASNLKSFSTEINEAKLFFNNYINLINSYQSEAFDFYMPTTLVQKVVILPDGNNKTITLPTENYMRKIKFYIALARFNRYKNDFENLKYQKEGNAIRITGTRTPSTSPNDKFPISMLVKKYQNEWIVLEEITYTKNTSLIK